MNASVQRAFDTLQESLQTLIESIASYNPSPAAATAVIDAEDHLTSTLGQLEEHQQTYHQIATLTAISASLDSELTSLLQTLSQTRKELQAVPNTTFPPSHGVPYEELLTYARKISKYTVPPQSSSYHQSPAIESSSNSVENEERGLPLGLSEADVNALDPSQLFTPWPSEEVMKQGALARMAAEEEMRAAGLLPVTVPAKDTNGASSKAPPEKRPELDNGIRRPSVAMDVHRHERPQETVRPGLSLSLDLYDPDED
ncbi:hypothetical protein RUND412_006789 [Rhizina undulata]